MPKPEYYKMAESLAEDCADLQKSVLIKHTACILEELHDQIRRFKKREEDLLQMIDIFIENTGGQYNTFGQKARLIHAVKAFKAQDIDTPLQETKTR